MDIPTIKLLRSVPIFASLPESLLQELARHSRRRLFKPHETLFHGDDPGYTLYIVVSGRVLIQTTLASGVIVTHAQRGPGEHFGELALIDGQPRMADAVTAVPSELLILHRQEFLACIESSPSMALSIMANLADRLREAGRGKESQQELSVLGRVSEALLQLLPIYGEAQPSGGMRITVKVTQNQLADQLGTTRESVNRALSSLKTADVIHSDGRYWIVLDRERLEQCSKV